MPPFRKDSRNVYLSDALASIPWLEHGFGTRGSSGWTALQATVTLKQIHSDVVIPVKDRTGCIGEGDALITESAGILLSVRTADCVPVLIADRRRRAVAAIHAGWRGTADLIAAKTVIRMEKEFGSAPGDLCVAIGPSIGECCYTVSEDVAAKFARWLAPAARIDLVEANCRQLELAGIPRTQIDCARLCTRCEADFHSFRRDREAAGRMESAIAIRTV